MEFLVTLQILSLLPPIAGKHVIELGAGIGRFTAEIAKTAGHVLAMDFMQNLIDKVRCFVLRLFGANLNFFYCWWLSVSFCTQASISTHSAGNKCRAQRR
jgi:predicted RNA methylase